MHFVWLDESTAAASPSSSQLKTLQVDGDENGDDERGGGNEEKREARVKIVVENTVGCTAAARVQRIRVR